PKNIRWLFAAVSVFRTLRLPAITGPRTRILADLQRPAHWQTAQRAGETAVSRFGLPGIKRFKDHRSPLIHCSGPMPTVLFSGEVLPYPASPFSAMTKAMARFPILKTTIWPFNFQFSKTRRLKLHTSAIAAFIFIPRRSILILGIRILLLY